MNQIHFRFGRPLVFPFLISLAASFVLAEDSAASVPATSGVASKVEMKQLRAKRGAKKHTKAVKPVAHRAAPVEQAFAVPATEPADLVMKPDQAAAAPQPAAAAEPQPAAAAEPQQTPLAEVPTNPYLANRQPMPSPASWKVASAAQGLGGFKPSLPQIPLFEQAILPKVQTVYPTGEKPLVVVTFKCPTELVGIDTPSTIILHKVVNGGMDVINRSNLLSFNLQQVCQ